MGWTLYYTAPTSPLPSHSRHFSETDKNEENREYRTKEKREWLEGVANNSKSYAVKNYYQDNCPIASDKGKVRQWSTTTLVTKGWFARGIPTPTLLARVRCHSHTVLISHCEMKTWSPPDASSLLSLSPSFSLSCLHPLPTWCHYTLPALSRSQCTCQSQHLFHTTQEALKIQQHTQDASGPHST